MRDGDGHGDQAAPDGDAGRCSRQTDRASRDALRADLRTMLPPAALSFACLALAFLAPPADALAHAGGHWATDRTAILVTGLGFLLPAITAGMWIRGLRTALRRHMR